MPDWNPNRKTAPKTPLPDLVTPHIPKEEERFWLPEVATNIEVLAVA